jgi:hypothetical protein
MKHIQLFEDFTLNEHRYTSHKPFEYFYNVVIQFLEQNKDREIHDLFETTRDTMNRYEINLMRLDEIITARGMDWDYRDAIMTSEITDENYVDYLKCMASQFRFGYCYGAKAPQAVYNNQFYHYIALRLPDPTNWQHMRTLGDVLELYTAPKAKVFLSHEFTHFVDKLKIQAHNMKMHKKHYSKTSEPNKRKSPSLMGYQTMWTDYWNNTHEFNAYINMMLMNLDVNEYPTYKEYLDEVVDQLNQHVPRFMENISPDNKKKMMKVVYDYYANYSKE